MYGNACPKYIQLLQVIAHVVSKPYIHGSQYCIDSKLYICQQLFCTRCIIPLKLFSKSKCFS